MNYKYNL